MDRWSNRVAVVTGASVGIGASIVVELTKAGMIVVGLARRAEKVEELRSQVPGNLRKNLHALKCDVSNEQEIVATFNEIDKKFGGVSVLVNNAGIICEGSLLDQGNAEKLRSVIDVNIFGLVFCTREAYRLMKKHKIDDGHIVHINSIAGHKVPAISQEFGEDLNFNIYSPSKHAVTALTQVYRNDLMNAGTKIKVTVSILNLQIIGN